MIGAVRTERRDRLAGPPSLQIDGDRTIVQRVRQLADQGDRRRRIDRERTRLVIVADRAQDPRAFSVTVQNAAQIIVVVEERVGLIDQQCRLMSFDHAEDRGRCHVLARQRARHQAREHVE